MIGARSLTGVSEKSYSYAAIRDVVSTQRNLAPQEITVEGVLASHFTEHESQDSCIRIAVYGCRRRRSISSDVPRSKS
jgi:hypothetical protein